MSKTCGAQYILKDCQCLADPFDRYSTICGYINKIDGLLYGCDTGCCSENCDNLNKIPEGLENRPSTGVSLPPGYNVNLPTSSDPNPVGAPFVPAEPSVPPASPLASLLVGPQASLLVGPQASLLVGPQAISFAVWKLILIAVIPLILVAFLSCFI